MFMGPHLVESGKTQRSGLAHAHHPHGLDGGGLRRIPFEATDTMDSHFSCRPVFAKEHKSS